MTERRLPFWTLGEEMYVDKYLKFDIQDNENEYGEAIEKIEIHQLHQPLYGGLQSSKTQSNCEVKKIRQNSQAISTDTSGAVLGTIGNIFAGITRPLYPDFYSDRKKSAEELSQAQIDDGSFERTHPYTETSADFVGIHNNGQENELSDSDIWEKKKYAKELLSTSSMEENKPTEPKFENYIGSIPISKIKRGVERRLNSVNVQQLPFVLTTSTTPSYNLGINIQQIMNSVKTKPQGRRRDPNPLLVSRDVYPCLLCNSSSDFEYSSSSTTTEENEKNEASSETEIRTINFEFEETSKFNGCVPPIISVKTKKPNVEREVTKDTEIVELKRERLKKLLKKLYDEFTELRNL